MAASQVRRQPPASPAPANGLMLRTAAVMALVPPLSHGAAAFAVPAVAGAAAEPIVAGAARPGNGTKGSVPSRAADCRSQLLREVARAAGASVSDEECGWVMGGKDSSVNRTMLAPQPPTQSAAAPSLPMLYKNTIHAFTAKRHSLWFLMVSPIRRQGHPDRAEPAQRLWLTIQTLA